MLGELTRGRAPRHDTGELLALLDRMGHGESDTAYIAKRLSACIQRHTLPDDLVAALDNMTPNALMGLINRMAARPTIYDLPRTLVSTLAARWAHGPRGPRALHL